ncbi:NUDIX hydrolase [Streptomyces hypolithicus]
MPIPAAHIQAVVTVYLAAHPEERAALQPLLDGLDAGRDMAARETFDGHVTTSAVIVNDHDQVLLIHHVASNVWIQPGGHCEPSDRTLMEAVLREVAEETSLVALEPFGGIEAPIHIDVHELEARPEKREPRHRHFDVRFVFRARGETPVTLQVEEVSGARWRGPSELGDPVLRARVGELLGRPREDRPAEEDPYGTVVVISDASGRVLMHLRDDRVGLWAPGTWAPMGGGAEPEDVDPHATAVRELREEVALTGVELRPMFKVLSDGYPVHVFHGWWDGEISELTLGEGTDLAWIEPGQFADLPIHPSMLADTMRVLELVTPRPAPYGYGTLALIRNADGHLLMHLRGDGPGIRWPSTWSPNGGKPEAEDQGPYATIAREVKEEIGLSLPLTHAFTHTAANGHLSYVFEGRWDGNPDTLTLTEGVALGWVDPRHPGALPMSDLIRYVTARALGDDLETQARIERIAEFVASAMIIHDGRVLVVRRNPEDFLGGTWEIPGGRITDDEPIVDGLLRETLEETGLAITHVEH